MRSRLLLGALIGWFAFAAGLLVLIACLRPLGAAGPAQPIAFSHTIHIGTVGLECTHCHETVARSSFPGIPSVSICMGCHESAAIDRPEVKKLRAFWAEKRAIEWVKVHELPWHVGFTHKRHVRAGVDCAECHGEVKFESRIRQVRSLTMGWCLACHRQRGAPRDCWTCHR